MGGSSFFLPNYLSLFIDKKEDGRRRMGEVVGKKEEMGEKKWKEEEEIRKNLVF